MPPLPGARSRRLPTRPNPRQALLEEVVVRQAALAVLPSVTLTLATQGPGRAALLAGGLLLIEQVVGNWIDPKLQGRRLALSPFAVLVSVLFFGWLWGIAGAFLAVPMLAFFVAAADRVPELHFAAVLLRGEEGLDAR